MRKSYQMNSAMQQTNHASLTDKNDFKFNHTNHSIRTGTSGNALLLAHITVLQRSAWRSTSIGAFFEYCTSGAFNIVGWKYELASQKDTWTMQFSCKICKCGRGCCNCGRGCIANMRGVR